MTPSIESYTNSPIVEDAPQTKICSKCMLPKSTNDFHKSLSNRDGLQGWCKICMNAALRTRADKKMEQNIASDRALYASMEEIDRPLGKVCSHKECLHVGIAQAPENFSKRRFSPDGLAIRCRKCELGIKRKYLSAEEQEEYVKLWRNQNKEELNKLTREWRKANPEECRRLHIERRFRNYGVTPQWYDDQLARQGGGCGICGGTDPKNKWETFHVDHNHSCCSEPCHACDDCRRGLLCTPCNVHLGHLEKIDWKRKAIAYLNKYSKKPAIDPNQGSLFDF